MQTASAIEERRWRSGAAILAILLLSGCQLQPAQQEQLENKVVVRGASIAALAVPVSAAENRAVSFTNKRSAYYYSQTHRNDHPEHAYFRGFNVAGRRIFSDYRLTLGELALDPMTATVVVQPDVLIRHYPDGITESLRLFDDRDVVEIGLDGSGRDAATLELIGETLERQASSQGADRYVSRQGEAQPHIDYVAVGRREDRFLIAAGPTQDAADSLLQQALEHAGEWRAARAARLDAAINGDHFLLTDDPRLTVALRWLSLSTDSLVTKQRGAGIYAGLPWFNEYWGRDSFIALPGATLVTGRFEEARAILVSFAQFQEVDPASPFYGRLPNIVKPGSIDYHTTDGTPRWVIALRDYVRYTGDAAIVAELYPHVRASIEGALARYTDAAGYLVHADNETWMDARREPDKASYSPRSTRANDIQALWLEQLRAGVEFAHAMNDAESAARWSAAAACLQVSFTKDFIDAAAARIADHLDAQGVPDFRLRPNAMFALPLVPTPDVAARALRSGWQALVYPWGVATLGQADPGFHPYHLAPEHYHKDAAYHNGAVWPWLNGVAMQRMLERGQAELAWQLFTNANAIVLTRGVVGGLPENLDAYPHPGESQPRLTGTYLQAWSNAEQLRIWYQGFLGVQPALDRGAVLLAPRLPAALREVEFVSRVGAGALHARYDFNDGGRRYTWRLEGQAASVELDIAPFAIRAFPMQPGESLVVTQVTDRLVVRQVARDGRTGEPIEMPTSVDRVIEQARLDAILSGTQFAQPGDAAAHPVMRQTRTP